MMADRGDRLPVLLVATLPGLATRFGWGFLLYQARRKRGVRAFRRELLRSGMPKQNAQILAQAYHEIGSVRALIHTRTAAIRRGGRTRSGSVRLASDEERQV